MNIFRIVSGGQTGADRGGLDAAIQCHVSHGGWCPKGRRAEDGRVPEQYHVREHGSKNYLPRTRANVADADATLIFTLGRISGGSAKTAQFAGEQGRPVLHVDLAAYSHARAVEIIVRWLQMNDALGGVLNIAGQRESKARGIQARVKECMVEVIAKSRSPIPSRHA